MPNPPKLPALMDREIGRRIRDQRLIKGFTRIQLAKILHVSHQQLDKYESGKNRVSSSRLFYICQALDVDANHFFDTTHFKPLPSDEKRTDEQATNLVKAFRKIEKKTTRDAVILIVKQLIHSHE